MAAKSILKEADSGFASALLSPLSSAFRRALCRIVGHRRSLPVMRGNSWHCSCERCAAKLIRVSPGIWRALSQEEHNNRSFERALGVDRPPGNLTNRARPRCRSAPGRGYSANYLARKHRITRQQARSLIACIGDSREKLNIAADKLSVLSGRSRD